MKEFIANIFELWGGCYFADFSKYMFKANLYQEVAIWLVLIPLIVFFIYYKPLDHIKLAKPSIWFAILIAVSLIVSLISFNISSSGIEDYLQAHKITKTSITPTDYFLFSCIVFVYTAILSFIYSMVLKLGSTKSRCIPF